MLKDNGHKENNKELVEIAAEQFARLFWKHYLYKKDLEKSRSRNQNRHKSNKDSA